MNEQVTMPSDKLRGQRRPTTRPEAPKQPEGPNRNDYLDKAIKLHESASGIFFGVVALFVAAGFFAALLSFNAVAEIGYREVWVGQYMAALSVGSFLWAAVFYAVGNLVEGKRYILLASRSER